MSCVAKNCKSVWTPKSNILFHRFPKDVKHRAKWLSKIPLKGKFNLNARLCSLHFKPADYEPISQRYLKNIAVPSYTPQSCDCTLSSTKTKSCNIEHSTSRDPLNIKSTSVNTGTTFKEEQRESNKSFLYTALTSSSTVSSHQVPQTGSSQLDINKSKLKPVAGAKIQIRNMPLEKDRSSSPFGPEDVEDNEKRTLKSTETRKIEFACPKCDKLFPVYFSCLRHIKKSHSTNENGDKIGKSSKETLKPIRTEICIHCNVRLQSSIHKCSQSTAEDRGDLNYYCVACKQTFLTMSIFDTHLTGTHCENVESMFFTNEYAFLSWKKDMESQTGCKYVLKGKYSSKDFYRCIHAQEPELSNINVLCPSTIVKQQFPKGHQVHFYLNHAGHGYEKYNLMEKYKDDTINNLLTLKARSTRKQMLTEKTEVIDNTYSQFKKLMENIVVDSANVDSDTLKTLMEKALEMTSVLTVYGNEDEMTGNKKHNNSNGLKNKSWSEPSEVPNKKAKNNETFSLNSEKDDEKILQELGDTVKVTSLGTPSTFGQSKFVDQYKDFVEKSFKSTKLKPKKKETVKTKIGQFKIRSRKKSVEIEVKEELEYSVTQYSTDTEETPVLSDLPTFKKDIIKYEVQEQEDGCNILILKTF